MSFDATVERGVGRLLLNRPQALNAIDGPMFGAIRTLLERWHDDPAVRAVTIRGAGRAFSAGGDIKYTVATAKSGERDLVDAIYRNEYAIDAMIDGFPKPLAALVHGVCMGGGMGLAMHAQVRVVSEDAMLAMPETEIGFFPDCGVSWLLLRLPGAIGTYLALTGARVGAADARWLGLATHVVRSGDLDAVQALVERAGGADPSAAIAELAIETAPSPLAALRPQIDAAFGADSMSGIAATLERADSGWARDTLATLRRMSPTALCLTFELLQRERGMELEAALQLEYELARRTAFTPEFHEGVRAVVIDKDRRPAWSPARIEDVDLHAVSAYLDELQALAPS